MQGRTAQQVVQDANAAIGANAVAAAQRLPSGETILTFYEKEGRAKWESDERLLRTFGPGATLRTKTFTVLAYRVPTTLSIDNQKEAIAKIYSQNPSLKDRVTITRVGRARKDAEKPTAPLYIGVVEPEQANYLIRQGLLWGSMLYNCEPYFKECRVTQCLQCWEYGHIAKHCTKAKRCGYCATTGHSSEECLRKEDNRAYRCSVCRNSRARHTA